MRRLWYNLRPYVVGDLVADPIPGIRGQDGCEIAVCGLPYRRRRNVARKLQSLFGQVAHGS